MKAELILSRLRLPDDRAVRSQGVHVSGIIRSIAGKTGILKPQWVEDLSLIDISQTDWWDSLTSDSKLRIAIGLAWEEWYIPTLQTVTDHPGEMQVDGIYMTHDGESLDVIRTAKGDRHVVALHEVKTTYKSTKTVGNLETQWMWLAQTKAYCKGLDTLVAFVHVLFLCGDYKYPITPQLKVWRVEYSQAEIDDNWDVMTTYAKHMQAEENNESD